MTVLRAHESALLARIESCEVCASSHVAAHAGQPFGVVVSHRGHDVGVWSYNDGQFSFRNVASWDVVHRAPDVEHALALTVGMAASSRWWVT